MPVGLREFIASLEAEGNARLCAVWSEAEEDAARAFAEYSRAIDEAERTQGMSASASSSRQAGRTRSRILNDARRVALEADAALSARMLDIAIKRMAPALRSDGYSLSALAGELPDGCSWDVVRVHPDDAAEASALFADARIVPDAEVVGGFITECAGSGLTVDNTLATRIRRAWPEVAGALIARVHEMADK